MMFPEIKDTGMSVFEELGILAFARYYDLTVEEAITVINNSNDVFLEMLFDMKQAMMRYEHFAVKTREFCKKNKKMTRLDILDFNS